MKKMIRILIVILVLIVIVSYIIISLNKSSQPPEIPVSPELSDTPARVYGILESLGREIFLAPPVPRNVQTVFVSAGDKVEKGQPVCQLESDVEKAALEVARSRIQEIKAQISITEDNLRRKSNLYEKNAIAEFDYETLRLQLDYEKTLLQTAKAEQSRAEIQLNRLLLKSPIDGIVYKCDIRIGELFTPQDYQRVVLGRPEMQVRMFVEAFWRDRFELNQKIHIKDSETLESIGSGQITAVLPYMGARDFRTEDPLERIDVKYQQVIVQLDTLVKVPLGLLVQCELWNENNKNASL